MRHEISLMTVLIMTLCIPEIALAVPEELLNFGKTLTKLRTLPLETTTKANCPSDLTLFRQLSKLEIRNALQEPDYCKPMPCSESREWSYSFTTPAPSGQRGGGFPTLTFLFDSEDRVKSAKCIYAR